METDELGSCQTAGQEEKCGGGGAGQTNVTLLSL